MKRTSLSMRLKNLYFHVTCSESTKSVLIAASYIQLKHKDQVKFTSELPTLNPRILLSGPAGLWFGHICLNSCYQILGSRFLASELLQCDCIYFPGSDIYQEMLAKALAHYFGAKLLIFDSHSFLGVRLETLLHPYLLEHLTDAFVFEIHE